MQNQKNAPVCWLFCTVIDNLGDVGVCWRLAQILSSECGLSVHFWLDDAGSLKKLCPDLPNIPCRYLGIDIRRWQPAIHAEDIQDVQRPDLVIETFACDLPENVLDVMRRHRPLWLNWEYLSAENWAEAMHAKPSPQADGQQKYFWLMGFSERSGGLLRERNYPELIRDSEAFRAGLVGETKTAPEWLLFGYESPVWARWLAVWQHNPEPVTLWLADRQIINSLKTAGAIPPNVLQNDCDRFQTGMATLVKLPFVAQQDFDRLLQLCDGMIVRGEDSFVRAQLSGKPFFWHIYPQEEKVHIGKLHAFWNKVYPLYSEAVREAHRMLSDDLNGTAVLAGEQRQSAWQILWMQINQWQSGSRQWQNSLFAQQTASEKLAKFMQGKIK